MSKSYLLPKNEISIPPFGAIECRYSGENGLHGKKRITINWGYFVHRGNFEHHGVTLYAFSKHITIFSKQTFLLLLFTRPLSRDGGMSEDHGAPEAGQLPRVWTRGRRETESRQRVSGAKSS